MKVARVLVILVAVVGLTLGSIGNVFAAEPSLVHVLSISGTVVEKGQTSSEEGFIELETAKKGLIKVLVTPETKYNVPGKEDATFEDIRVGDRVKVIATGITTNRGIIADEVTVLPQFAYKPQLVKKVWMDLPPQLLVKEAWMDLPP